MNEGPRRAMRFLFLESGSERRTSGNRVMWRLMSANNRPIGSSVRIFDDVEACRAAARSVHDASDTLRATTQFDHLTGTWTWRVAQRETPVAACVHSYLRRFECLRAVQQFVDGVAEARPEDGLVRQLGMRPLPVAAGIS